MAIDYTTSTSVADTLKLVYGEGIEQQFAQEETLYNNIPKGSANIGGKGYEMSVTFADPQSVGGRAESGRLPDPLVGKFDTTNIQPAYVYSTGRLTGPAIEKGKTNAAAFMDVMDNQIQGMYRATRSDLNRQCWGDGFGALAVLSSASDALSTGATWTITCDNAQGVRLLKPGMVVDFYDGANIDQSSVASRIASVDYVNNTAEMEAVAATGAGGSTYQPNHPIVAARTYTIATDAVPDGAIVVRIGARLATHATSDTALEMTGMDGIFDDGTLLATFQNITVATQPQWKANILSNSSVDRELSIDLLLQACNVNRNMSGDDANIMYMGEGQMRKYANLMLGDVRFNPQTLAGGYDSIGFAAGAGNIRMVVDRVCPRGKIYITTVGAVQKFELMPLGFLNRDQMLHQVTGFDEWDFSLAIYGNFGTKRRNACTLLKDLVEPSEF